MRGILFILLITSFAKKTAGNPYYNQWITKAELAITENDFNQALQFFDSAFACRNNPFAKDLYNATLCALTEKNYSQALFLCHKLAEKGVGEKFFEQSIYFVQLENEKGWQPMLRKAKQRREQLLKKQGALLSRLKELVETDQKMHRRWGESDFNHNLEVEMKELDDSLSGELLKIFKEKGYLSEDIIGPEILNGNNLSTESVFDIIILHNYQGRIKSDTLFTPILRQALAADQISPATFAMSQDRGNNKGDHAFYGTAHLFMIWNCALYKDQQSLNWQLDEIERARKEIGLEPFANYEKKVIYNIMHPGNPFLLTGHAGTVGSFADKTSEEAFIKNNTLLLDTIPNCKR